LKDKLKGSDGKDFSLEPPEAPELPAKGFLSEDSGYIAPAENGDQVKVVVDPDSERLQLLAPFAPWDKKDFLELPLLLKALGKCTTDHISAAGPWLRYRGHLDKISDNMFTGAINAFTKQPGTGLDVLSNDTKAFPAVARHYKAEGLGWVVVGDTNYGEGSSREHAAMSPRFLGCKAVIVRSFARIHETNLKKQGILALTFIKPEDYDVIQEKDRISLTGLADLKPGKPVDMTVHHADGKTYKTQVKHTMTEEQIGWFKAGSALNLIRQKREGK
jgi:aconitate hydratase